MDYRIRKLIQTLTIAGAILLAPHALAQIPFGMMRAPCPEGYIFVPHNPSYTSHGFCVMKYEAKNDAGKPVSRPSGLPWVNIVRGFGSEEAGSAWAMCRSLGRGYNLISNDEWQTIARNIVSVPHNWSGGVVNTTRVNSGHTDNSPSNAVAADPAGLNLCFNAGTSCNESAWAEQKRTHRLSNGTSIWDFGGNVYEHTRTNEYYSPGPNAYISEIASGVAQALLGSLTFCSAAGSAPYCGFGFYSGGGANFAWGTIIRGGNWTDPEDGILGADLARSYDYASNTTGFRCVYHPVPNVDPCDGTPGIGSTCAGGARYAGIYNGAKYMVTPSGCDASASPTCTGSADTLTLRYRATGLSSLGAASTLDDGADNTSQLHLLYPGVSEAGVYCANMVYGGYSDWFLPARDELASFSGVRTALGFNTGDYWSSSESTTNNAFRVNLAASTSAASGKANYLYTRCMRRY